MGSNALDDRRAGIDIVLTNLSIGRPLNQKYIGNALAPTIPVPISKVRIPVWGTEAFRIREDRVGDYSEPDKLDISVSTTLLEVDGHALMAPVSDRHQIEGQRGPLQVDLDFEALQTIDASMDLSREKLQADLITSTSIYATSHKVDLNGVSRLWDAATNGVSDNDPLDDIIPMMETTIPDDSGEMPNTFWMGQQVWAGLNMNTKLRARAYGTVGPVPMLTPAKFADLLQIAPERVLIGRALSIAEGGTVTKLWGKNAGLCYVPPTAGKRIPAFAYTVEETVFGNASQKVIRFRDEKMGASGGEWIKESRFYTPVVVGATSGALFYNCVS